MPSCLHEQVRFVGASSERLSCAEEVATGVTRPCYEQQFLKTIMCSFYAKGKCMRRNFCKYAHNDDELRPRPDLTNTSLCPIWAGTGVCGNPMCKFAHDYRQLRATGRFYKTSLCKFHLGRGCRMGEECRHAHGIEELRATPAALPAPLVMCEGGSRSQRRKQKAHRAVGKEATSLPGQDCLAAESFVGASATSVAEQWLEQAPMGLDEMSLESAFGGFSNDAGLHELTQDAKVPFKVWLDPLFAMPTLESLPSLQDPDALGLTSGPNDRHISAEQRKEGYGGYESAVVQSLMKEGGLLYESSLHI